MQTNLKCWKKAGEDPSDEKNSLQVGNEKYLLRDASDSEIALGKLCLEGWYVERKYKTQVAGLGRVYYEMRSDFCDLGFEELIFDGENFIGAYHDELIFLFDDAKTHYIEKYLGEMPTGADQSILFYDYYYLHSK